MLLLHPLPNPILCSSKYPKPLKNSNLFLQFKTSHKTNLHYLKNLGIITSVPTPHSPEKIHYILTIVDFLKSKGFSDSDFARLSYLAPSIFSSTDINKPFKNLDPIFSFLHNDLLASQQEVRGLVLRCPDLLTSNPTYRLEPTLHFLRKLGIVNLNVPTNLNAHLLNTPVDKLVSRIEFLEDWGLGGEICKRFPAIFGYSVENNLRPKVEYLVYEMKRDVEEVNKFPQYFGFSLEKRIVPRHLHLRERNVAIALNRMLLWGDDRFYAKWK